MPRVSGEEAVARVRGLVILVRHIVWIVLSFRDVPAEQHYREGELNVHHDCPYCGAGET